MPSELPSVLTPISTNAALAELHDAWVALFNSEPSHASLCLLLAQWALETGRGVEMHCWNWGNVKSHDGDGHDWCFYACGETFTAAAAQAALAADRAHVCLVRTHDNGTVDLLFAPPHPETRFRAFHSAHEGAIDYLGLLARRFASAWSFVLAGDIEGFVHQLALHVYFTTTEAIYLARLRPIFGEFLTLPVVEPVLPWHADDETKERVLNLVALTTAELARSLEL